LNKECTRVADRPEFEFNVTGDNPVILVVGRSHYAADKMNRSTRLAA
jgi:hypothetical protein